MSFKISIKTPADINKEAVKFEKDSENDVAEVEGDGVIPAKDSSQVALTSEDDISRILNRLQANKPYCIPDSTKNIDDLTSLSISDTYSSLSPFHSNNMSLETRKVEAELTDEPLPFIPKLIPIQSLSNHVRKDVVSIPSAIVLEDTVLPNGWRKVVKQRQSGRSAGRPDVYVFTPLGQRFRSRAEMARYIEKTGDTSASVDIFAFTRKREKIFSSTVDVNNSRIEYQHNQNTVPSLPQFQVPGAIKEQMNISANKDMNEEWSDEISSIIDEKVEQNEHLLFQKLNALQGNQIKDPQDERNKPEPGYGAGQKRKFEIDLADFLEVQIE